MAKGKKLKNFIFKKTFLRRRVFFFVLDTVLISTAMLISFWLRFDWKIPEEYASALPYFILLTLFCKLSFLLLYNLYDISWRFVGIIELWKVFKAVSLGSLTLGMALYFLRLTGPFLTTPFPRSIILIDFVLSLTFIGSLRASKRVLQEGLNSLFKSKKPMRKILIIGAGTAGEQIVREMKRNMGSMYMPIGFVDDDPAKHGINMHGVRVLGSRREIPAIISNHQIDDTLIAIPSSKSKDIREISQIIRDTGFEGRVSILPSASDLINGNVTLSDIHEISLTDLLGRAAVHIDFDVINSFLKGKKILITGAGGSIGSELAKSALRFGPEALIILDVDETEIYYLFNKIHPSHCPIFPVIGDVKDSIKMESVFKEHSPHIVLHAAAYKHVPIMEFYPEEALKTNIMGTKIVGELAIKYRTEKFINISTDKAINPSSIMGATKRAAEELLKVLDQKNSTKFISVRFGNVLGSRGSVIPCFREQISRGGPVTVTHPEMKRYFMITSEAVLLVLEAGAIGKGGEVFVLDMGEQIKIVDLAKEMIALISSKNGKDIPIIFTRIRPGEKLYEEIIGAEEGVEPTKFEKLLVARKSKNNNPAILMKEIDKLIELGLEHGNKDEIVTLLRQIIPTYKPYQDKSMEIIW